MIKSEKKLNELSAVLNKNNNNLIFKTIELLRKEQPFEGAIVLLVTFYDNTDDASIKKAIWNFLNDLKDQSVTGEIISEIKKEWKAETLNMLISSCWQSGLDYSEYVLDLTEVFIRSNYATAIECFSAIEGTISRLSKRRREDIVNIIEKNLPAQENEKRILAQELLSILG